MLVTFSCPAYGKITLFGDVALKLLKMMGHSQTVPGALLADDIPAALTRLEKNIAADIPSPQEAEEPDTMTNPVSASLTGHCLSLSYLRQPKKRAAMSCGTAGLRLKRALVEVGLG